ncbi:MAG: Tex family protein [Lachnospiraceae bacterium]|nr:Tex family protein [Lachnospiraceae bacterium]
MDINRLIAQELGVRQSQVDAAVKLIDEGNTIPFIARYRKDQTGALNDEVLRNLDERLTYLRNLKDRKQHVLESIEEQGKLTVDLKKKIVEAETLVAVEDLYLPYKPKRRTRATMARERGLEGLANILRLQMTKRSFLEEAEDYVNQKKDVKDVQAAIAGAKDIVAESVSEDADFRTLIRKTTKKYGRLAVKAKDSDQESVYEQYYDFHGAISKLKGYQILAVNRGEKEKFLNVHVEAPDAQIIRALKNTLVKDNPSTKIYMEEAVEDAYTRLIAPAIERDLRTELTETAQEGAIEVFGKNLKQLLMQPPIKGHTVLGWDPAFRTGCKLAVVDSTGKVLDHTVIFPTAPQNDVDGAKKTVAQLIKKYGISLISVGNGTASRESEQVIVEILKEVPQKVSYVIVNEAGASVYSASKLGTEEFPQYDVGTRSAASIARRLQDPLAELVKIDPKAIGVGQYQHDMNQKNLAGALETVVEDCVNAVGVDLNTASFSLLSYISGISKTVAKNIVAYREENGSFHTRKELLKVPKLGPKAFLQCAGFLRISGGKEALDNTAVHPESYNAAKEILKRLGYSSADIAEGGIPVLKKKAGDLKKLAASLDIGALALDDILSELEKPGRDPRSAMPKPILRTDVLTMDDLKEGMILKGTVRNVIDFGAFVDIGVHEDGLVHISEMADRFIRHPSEVVSVGDIVEVKVLGVDKKRKRIQLSMRL